MRLRVSRPRQGVFGLVGFHDIAPSQSLFCHLVDAERGPAGAFAVGEVLRRYFSRSTLTALTPTANAQRRLDAVIGVIVLARAAACTL